MVARPKPPQPGGETTLTSKNQVSLPAKSIRELGWKRGDRLIVEVIAPDMVVLFRWPDDPAEYFAGKLTDVFGTHEENIQWIEEERSSWEKPG